VTRAAPNLTIGPGSGPGSAFSIGDNGLHLKIDLRLLARGLTVPSLALSARPRLRFAPEQIFAEGRGALILALLALAFLVKTAFLVNCGWISPGWISIVLHGVKVLRQSRSVKAPLPGAQPVWHRSPRSKGLPP
jgi:hypothetical protein